MKLAHTHSFSWYTLPWELLQRRTIRVVTVGRESNYRVYVSPHAAPPFRYKDTRTCALAMVSTVQIAQFQLMNVMTMMEMAP